MNREKFFNSLTVNHIIAFVTIMLWGTTFVSTKKLLLNDITASQIMIFRFLGAYLLMLPFTKKFRSNSLKDEALFLLSGICGGSLYFFTENLALNYTMVTNVSLILCFTPIITLLLTRIFLKSVRITRYATIGSIISLFGVALVIFNGSFVLKLSPVGDILVLIAALSWGTYGILLKKLEGRYSALFITRKVFFYGIITLLPVSLYQGFDITWEQITRPEVIFNLTFLSLVASLGCFIIWTRTVRILGATTANNYIYLQPIASLTTSHIFLGEEITILAVIGGLFVIFGLLFVERAERIFTRFKRDIARDISQERLKS